MKNGFKNSVMYVLYFAYRRDAGKFTDKQVSVIIEL
jgi:hypothetical protein